MWLLYNIGYFEGGKRRRIYLKKTLVTSITEKNKLGIPFICRSVLL